MSRSLTKFFAFVLVAGFAFSAFAQDESNIIRPITKSGSAAFVFNISGLGAFGPTAPGIGTANGTPVAGAGIKYYLSDDLAAKILLAFGMTDNGVEEDKGTNVSTTQLGLGAIIEVHFGPLYSTSPYAGGGIHFASAGTTSKTSVGGTASETSSSGTQITIMGVAGFDWFFTRGMAIGAEWSLGYTMNSSSSETTGSPSVDGPSNSTLGLGMTGNGAVHAVVYF
jgi:hypothetical protein